MVIFIGVIAPVYEELVFRFWATARTGRALAFALTHIGNYDSSQNMPMFFVAVLHKFGMGLVASYLVINHNLLWSIGLHILNNGILAMLLGVSFNMVANETTVIESEDFRITMQPVLTKSQMPDTYTTGWESDIVFTDIGCPSYAVQSLVRMDHQGDSATIASVSAEWESYPMMNIKVEMFGERFRYGVPAVRIPLWCK